MMVVIYDDLTLRGKANTQYKLLWVPIHLFIHPKFQIISSLIQTLMFASVFDMPLDRYYFRRALRYKQVILQNFNGVFLL